uniref:CCR4-NOT transcription complex subunit 10 n=1 Tax=Ixodes ricinus TaxID=34613 RepID=A0A131XTM8_IXORI
MSDKEANGDGGKPAESAPTAAPSSAVVVSEQEKQLAATATAEFNAGRYASCIEALDKLRALRPTDGKVAHNRAIARFYASGKKNSEELAQDMAEVASLLHVNLASPDSLDDVDQCVPFFNHAVSLYHAQQYRKAVAILDRLFQFIEPLDESVTRKICFLYIELCLCLKQPEKVLGLIAYAESLVFGSRAAAAAAAGETPSPLEKDEEPREPAKLGAHWTRLQQYKTRCFMLLRSTKASKREIKSLVNSGAPTSQTVFLRSQLEFMRGNYRKAVKVLCTAQLQGDPKVTAMYHNNVGCVHFYTGKPHLGCFSFDKALRAYHEGVKAGVFDNRMYYELVYNLGVQNLHAGRYVAAFDCLVEAVRFQPTNARLWLRIAECCVYRHKSDNAIDFQLKERKLNMVRGTVGSGPYRKIVLAPSISTDRYVPVGSDHSAAIPVPTLEFATLCLKNALLLLPETAASETGSATSVAGGDDTAQPGNGGATGSAQTPPHVLDEVAALRNSALALAAYVALCLNDVVIALEHAESLLSQPRISGIHSFLGHLYAAEALLLLDRVPDAVEHLNPELVTDLSYGFPGEADDSGNNKDGSKPATPEAEDKAYRKPWYPASTSTARVISLYNLAVAYTLRGGLSKATETLRLVSASKGQDPEIPVQALMLAIYVQLQQGHADLAKSIIKQHLPQYT